MSTHDKLIGSRHAAPSILALDLGLSLGFAIMAQGAIRSGTYRLEYAKGDVPARRYQMFRDGFLRNFTSVREVHYEAVHRHEGTAAAHIYGALEGMLQLWCLDNYIPCTGVGVNVWKKAVTGKGNANKEAVMKSMQKRGFTPEDFDESDALAILHYVRHFRSDAA